MAETVVGAKLTLDGGQANESMKTFKTQIREANQDLIKTTELFGATSREAATAAKRVAELKDRMGDAKNLSDAFNPDRKFQSFSNALSGVAGGFAALQGAMALVGAESEDIQKSLLKVQAALAISQGVNSIIELKDTFKTLGAFIQSTAIYQKANAVATTLAAGAMRLFGVATTQTSVAFNVLKGAIIATGIGALVVLIGVVIQAINSMASADESAADAKKRLAEETDRLSESLQQQIGWSDRASKLDIAAAKARGASLDEITKLERKGIENRIFLAQTAYNDAVRIGADTAKLQKSLSDEDINLKVFDYQQKEKINQRADEDRKKRDEKLKQNIEKEKQERRAFLERERTAQDELQKQKDKNYFNSIQDEDQRKRAEIETEALRNSERINNLLISEQTKKELLKQAKIQEDFELGELDMEIAEKKKVRDAAILQQHHDLTVAYLEQLGQATKEKGEEQIKIDQAVHDNKIALAYAASNAIGELAGLFRKESAAAKVLALTTIAINTAVGFINGLRIAQQSAIGTGPAAAFAMPIFYATQIAAVLVAAAKAKAILGSGGGEGGSSGPSVGGGGSQISAPAPLLPTQTSTALNQREINNTGNAAAGWAGGVRAYVLESEGSSAQERAERLRRASVLGG